MDYQDLGLTKRLRAIDSIAGRERLWQLDIANDLYLEKSPYAAPTMISKGTVQTILGGKLEVRDSTGGTILLTADPETGTVTIGGPMQANVTLNLGTISDTTIAGNGTIAGTIVNNRLMTKGTWSAGTFGTCLYLGGSVNNTVIGTSLVIGGTVNSTVLGTPTITGGAYNSGTLGTPVIQAPTIDGTPNFDINAGSAALGADGNLAIQTFGTAGILAVRVGGTTFYFTPTGTI